MNLKTWFNSFFKSTKNELRINELISRFNTNATTQASKNLFFESAINSIRLAIEDTTKTLLDISSTFKDFEQYKDRIVRLEGMYIDTFKLLNETFNKAMQTLIAESANTNRYTMKRAEEIIKEIKKKIASPMLSIESDVTPKDEIHVATEDKQGIQSTRSVTTNIVPAPSMSSLVTVVMINGNPIEITAPELSYQEIIELAIDQPYPSDTKFYVSSDDTIINAARGIKEGESLVIKEGLSITVSYV